MKRSQKTLASYKKRIEAKEKESHKEVLESIEEGTKNIDSIIDLFLGKEDKRQGIVRNLENSVVSRISIANRYVQSRPTGITSTEEKLLEHAREDLKTALEKTNAFFKEQWEDLKSKIEAVQLSEFEETKLFEIE